jgi:hypothetical protein
LNALPVSNSSKGKPIKYCVRVYETPEDFASRTNQQAQSYWGAYTAFGKAMHESGVATGTSLRIRGGKRHIQDGPFADSKEQLGGFFIIDVSDFDAALEWAARCPSAQTGGVEVRPIPCNNG